MNRQLTLFFTVLFAVALTSKAEANLVTIGTATYGGLDYNLIWDNDNNDSSLVWLDYSSPLNTWYKQLLWAAGLNSVGVLSYDINPGYSVDWGTNQWRLPSTVDGPYVFGYDGTTTGGYNITSSEMGHLFYDELGNLGYYDTSGNQQVGYGLNITGGFTELVSSWYWSGTIYAADQGLSWGFRMQDGLQHNFPSTVNYPGYGLAVRSGEVTEFNPIPEPATMLLLGTGLVGVAGAARRKKKNQA